MATIVNLPLSTRLLRGVEALRNAGLKAQLQDRLEQAFRDANTGLLNHKRGNVFYVDENGTTVVIGQDRLEALLKSSSRPGGAIYASPLSRVDGAFEGGGAKGFFFLGAAHALAHTGVWFDRVAGTSAGSICAALVAAGYRVDLNYQVDVLTHPRGVPLKPSSKNSLNKILFEDELAGLPDFEERDDPNIAGSWSQRALEAVLQEIPFFKELEQLENALLKSKVELTDPINESMSAVDQAVAFLESNPIISSIGAAELHNIRIAREAVTQTTQKAEDAANAVISDLQSKFKKLFSVRPTTLSTEVIKMLLSDDFPETGVQHESIRAVYRLLEHGGFWTGDRLRDWLERHIRVMVPGRSAENGYVAFKDLPMDLCVTAVDVGRPGGQGPRPSHSQVLYFSKKSTPNYSVSEAVRRSVSLPFSFYPKTLEENNGSPVSSGHAGNLLLDGGFRVNLPIGVFRDTENQVMPDNYDTNGKPKRVLIAFNLDDLDEAPPRPDGVPYPDVPKPISSIFQTGSELIDEAIEAFKDGGEALQAAIVTRIRAGGVTGAMLGEAITEALEEGLHPRLPEGGGFERMLPSLRQVLDYGQGGSAEQQIVDLLAIADKVLPINIPVLDPVPGDNRVGGLDFGVPKITKKWWCHSAWISMARALDNLDKVAGRTLGDERFKINSALQPYLHELVIQPSATSAVQVVPRACYGDTLFTDRSGMKVLPAAKSSAALGYRLKDTAGVVRYLGPGSFWVKRRHADRNATAPITIAVNLPVRLYILYPAGLDLPISFARTMWVKREMQLAAIDETASVQNPEFVVLAMYSKDFPAGKIELPSLGTDGTTGHVYNYTILVMAR